MPAWRAKAHELTRSRVFLAKAVAAILGISALVSVTVYVSLEAGARSVPASAREDAGLIFKAEVRDSVRRFEQRSKPAPDQLIDWMRKTAAWWMEDPEVREKGFDPAALRLAGIELHPVLAKHATSEAQREAMEAYVRFRFLPDGDARMSALETLGQTAQQTPSPHAHEMHGDALVVSDRPVEALKAYVREIDTPTATHARKCAVELALHQEDKEALTELASRSRVVSDMSPTILWHVAQKVGDRRLIFRALCEMQWQRWFQGAGLPIALLTAAIWYVILVHTASREKLRWWRYLPAVFAGVASIWMLRWWYATLQYYHEPEDAPSMSHELMRWIMYVGLPEEAAKLLLFAFFLPVLLHHKSAVKAALTAGCVGLGFALNENLKYFQESSPAIAVDRLLTANFIHISLTGMAGWYLYELFRSKFHSAADFVMAFCAIVMAHGLYDFCASPSASYWGFDVASMIILGLCARHYLGMLHDQERVPAGGYAISRSSVFVLGTALLGGTLMILLVWELESLIGITLVLKKLVALAVVGLFYIREWKEVH